LKTVLKSVWRGRVLLGGLAVEKWVGDEGENMGDLEGDFRGMNRG
jgi:hypothetical protein